jgi:4'-phosphopantetheinyl transferase
MPLVFEKQITSAKKLAVWDITESFDFFIEKLKIERVPNRNEQRQIEQAAAIHLLNILSGKDLHLALEKDKFGKPFITDQTCTVSFSHSKNLVACLFCAEGSAVGVDIEYLRNNIHLLAKKFLSQNDQTGHTGSIHQQIAWGAKEVLYKIHGIKELNFIQHLHLSFENEVLFGQISKENYVAKYQLEHTLIENFVLVWNV